MDKKAVILSRPKDKSVEAVKAWIMEICTHITGQTDDDNTPEEWERRCKKFWFKAK